MPPLGVRIVGREQERLVWIGQVHSRRGSRLGTALSITVNTVIFFPMKTSLDLPDDLYRRVKSKSALEGLAVCEVATALFSAWVEGRVSTDPIAGPPIAAGVAADPRQEWLARWRDISSSVSKAGAGTPGLVDQLHGDRR